MTDVPQHHSINYVELTVTDLPAARKFYESAFGWTFIDYGQEYSGIQSPNGAGEVGGLLLATEPRPTGGPFVILYSKDLDNTANSIREAGGKVVHEAREITITPVIRRACFRVAPGQRHRGVCRSPTSRLSG